jgi:gamma-glutamyltranspeptidase / glutathione hydrolase
MAGRSLEGTPFRRPTTTTLIERIPLNRALLSRVAVVLVFLAGWAALTTSSATAAQRMVVTAHPEASRVADAVLGRGGSAIDAAIAAQMVLTLVEPQSSGIGGGAFLVYYDAASRQVTAYDGRETAPGDAGPDYFLRPDGTPMTWNEARLSGRSVGVPGVVRMLAMAHQDHGALPWPELFERAIARSREGFEISPRLHEAIARESDWSRSPAAAAYLLDGTGVPWPAGHRLRNPALAATLEALAGDPNALNTGTIAAQIIEAVRAQPDRPGLMTASDLERYTAKRRTAVCGPFRAYLLCGMPPPSSGPTTVLMILGIGERVGLHEQPPGSAEWAHLFAEAQKIAFADRNQYLADPDYVAQPVAGLLDTQYLDERAALIAPDRTLGKVAHGSPPGTADRPATPHTGLDEKGTSHLSILDGDGNIVSMTTTVEAPFGSRLMVAGFLLNNELTDFSIEPEQDGKPVANRVEGGKRPRSSMAPMIAFDRSGAPVLVVGSPGGSRIIAYVAGVAARVLGNSMEAQAAVEAAHIVDRNSGQTEVEAERAPADMAKELEGLGHHVKMRTLASGLNIIRITPQGFAPGVDPRREGLAIGD